MDQSHYIKSIEDVNIDVASRPGTEPLTESEKQEFRSAIGKLVWASTRTRPSLPPVSVPSPFQGGGGGRGEGMRGVCEECKRGV